ncbi:MAG: RNA polymerase sigma factor [Alphaproteobacteria bacterium]|nr:RNA polymerase sigma factor [Alphaproteobacteria bacterium]
MTGQSQEDIWKDWAIKAQKGDKKAYNALLNDLLPFIRGRLSGTLANPDWVEDVTQEVLISVHKSLYTYASDRPFKPWLMSIINFRKTDFLRKYYKNKKLREDVNNHEKTYDGNVTELAHLGELKDIESALGSLPKKQRKIFTLMKVEGYSAQEVSDEMGMSVSAVKVSAHRAANKLKERLE